MAAHAAAVAVAFSARAAGAAARAAGDLAASATLVASAGAADAAAACLLPAGAQRETEARLAAVRPVLQAQVLAAHGGGTADIGKLDKVKRDLAVHYGFGDEARCLLGTLGELRRRQRGPRRQRCRVHDKEETGQSGSQVSSEEGIRFKALDVISAKAIHDEQGRETWS
jgi:hypothetical protein